MIDDSPSGNGWSEYQRLVLTELKRHNEVLQVMNEHITELKVELASLPAAVDRVASLEESVRSHAVELAMLKVKAGTFGALGGVATAVGAYLIKHMFSQ